jgi:hypothetical protein
LSSGSNIYNYNFICNSTIDIHKVMNIKQAYEIVGSLGKPSKMPGFAYGTPAELCKTGSKLRKDKRSVCYKCYAMKGFYMFSNVKPAFYKRFEAMKHPLFVEAMTLVIKSKTKQTKYFRWKDSGDIDSLSELERIVMVCQNTPKVKHWLPTREVKIVSDYLKIYKAFPGNLVVRVSAPLVNGEPLPNFPNTSTVHSAGKKWYGKKCIAYKQNNECKDCRACWNTKVNNISYKQH